MNAGLGKALFCQWLVDKGESKRWSGPMDTVTVSKGEPERVLVAMVVDFRLRTLLCLLTSPTPETVARA